LSFSKIRPEELSSLPTSLFEELSSLSDSLSLLNLPKCEAVTRAAEEVHVSPLISVFWLVFCWAYHFHF